MKQCVTSWLIMVVVGVSLIGCGGGGAKVQTEMVSISTGQQLIDLKKALDAGAMTQTEYDHEREKILKRD